MNLKQLRERVSSALTLPYTVGAVALPSLIVMASLAPSTSLAQTPEAKGLEIAREADRRDQGFGDTVANLRMTLKNKQGASTTREMRSRTLEQENDGDKGLIIFEDPKDVKGTAFLTFTHKVGQDDQWLYLPALKRTKRIASNNKSGPFMGSEFAYEDLSSQEVEKYTYKFLREEELNGKPCFVLERYPVDPKSGYTRQVVWMDQAEYRVWKVEYFDRKKSHLKTLTTTDFQQYLDQYWRPVEMTMVNHQTGKSTVLQWNGFEFRTGLTEADFNRNALSKAR